MINNSNLSKEENLSYFSLAEEKLNIFDSFIFIWESFNKNLADARARKKKQLEELSRIKKTKELIAALIIGALVFGGGSYAAVYFFVQTVG